MNLHIVNDEKFINDAFVLFEKYAPSKNIFIVNSNQKKLKYVILQKRILQMDFSANTHIHKLEILIKDNGIKNLYLHYLCPYKAALANILKSKFQLKTFWIFYGADLYRMLFKDFGYQFHDNPIKAKTSIINKLKKPLLQIKYQYVYHSEAQKEIIECIQNLDYFCFWNPYDFALLKKHFQTNAKLLPFAYFGALNNEFNKISPKKKFKIMVNNSASVNGNHETILNKIYQIDKEKEIHELIVPLNYGNPYILKQTIGFGNKLFKNKFKPLLTFLDKNIYFNLLNDVSVAFFGARRQEAAANIFQLLATGVKVFLRNDNNMMFFLKDNGFLVYSFEDDFISMDSLENLTSEQTKINLQAAIKLYHQYDEKIIMTKLLTS